MGQNHLQKIKEAKKEKDELFKSGMKPGHTIDCNGTSSQKFWRRDYLLLRYFCCVCDLRFPIADAKDDHMATKHGNHVVCSTCCQVVPKEGAAHVNTVPPSFAYHVAGAGGAGADVSN